MKRRTKRRLLIGTCVIVIIAIIMLIINNQNNKNSITYNDGETYKVKVKLPEYNQEEETGYKYVENDENNPAKEVKNAFADFALVGDNANIEFEKKIYTFQNTAEYIKKYGKEEPNFENFKKYVLDEELTGNLYSNIKEITINGKEAIQYTYDDSVIIVLNTDNIDKESYIAIRVYSKLVDGDVNKLLEDEEIQNILNTIKFSKK